MGVREYSNSYAGNSFAWAVSRRISVLLLVVMFICSGSVSDRVYAQDSARSVLSKIFSSRTPANEKIPTNNGDASQTTSKSRKNSKNALPVPQELPCNEKIPGYLERNGMTLEDLFQGEDDIEPIEIERSIDFTPLPDGFDALDSELDPFKTSLTNTRDTFRIDVHDYCPPCTGYVTSNFGFRKWRHHNGIDLKVFRGDTIFCAFDGVVRIRRYDRRGYGYFVVVRHTNGLETIYGHMSKFLVQLGDSVKVGTPLGMGGSTGRSTGYHLHFEIRYMGNPLNPNDVIDFETHKVKNSTLLISASNFEYKKEIEKIRYWTVRKGDTLGRISKKTGVSISRLCKLNGITRKTTLRIGRRIRYT